MSLRVLIITNLFPTIENPISGTFVVKRLQQYKKIDVSHTTVSLGVSSSKFEQNPFLEFLRKALKKSKLEPLKMYQGVEFLPAVIEIGILEAFKIVAFSKYYKKIVEQYAEEIVSEVNIEGYDIIHAHGMYRFPAGIVAEKLAEKYSKPFLITVHGSDINLRMFKRKKEYVETFNKASKVIFVSKALLEGAKSLGYSGKNAIVIPNGYDPAIFKPFPKSDIRKELGIYKKSSKYVGFVGNLISVKRADKLPEIFKEVSRKLDDVKFIVVGEGYLRKEIEEKTKDLKVIFTGRIPQEEVAEWMSAMDVMILPSRHEGWPCVVLEAQACGTCVIGSSNGGIPEAIGFEEYVVEEGKDFEKRFAEKIVEVLKEGYDLNKFVKRAENFTWEEMVKREAQIYYKISKNI